MLDTDFVSVLSELTEDKAVREFWVTGVDHNLLYIHPERLLSSLEQKFALRIADRYQVSPSRGNYFIYSYVMWKWFLWIFFFNCYYYLFSRVRCISVMAEE